MTENNINNERRGRFLTAQDGKRGDYTLYELALKEIQEGKLGFECWIRYEDYKAFISLKCKTWAKNDLEEFQAFLFLDKSRTNTGGNDLLLVTFLHNLVL